MPHKSLKIYLQFELLYSDRKYLRSPLEIFCLLMILTITVTA
ncbi:hypothetical protein H1P_1140011 [Hyella patelloides LEGE 07179]|uniref:Uncharacterized protein n=1 Tax=Hyella patelloides LEGE 07179 TaxID=945734 RepID=A0A563VJQ6_9CYAN|nr:hypothetical protein H1P_1140011 [Hyella patelloides LEGE 07179]